MIGSRQVSPIWPVMPPLDLALHLLLDRWISSTNEKGRREKGSGQAKKSLQLRRTGWGSNYRGILGSSARGGKETGKKCLSHRSSAVRYLFYASPMDSTKVTSDLFLHLHGYGICLKYLTPILHTPSCQDMVPGNFFAFKWKVEMGAIPKSVCFNRRYRWSHNR